MARQNDIQILSLRLDALEKRIEEIMITIGGLPDAGLEGEAPPPANEPPVWNLPPTGIEFTQGTQAVINLEASGYVSDPDGPVALVFAITSGALSGVSLTSGGILNYDGVGIAAAATSFTFSASDGINTSFGTVEIEILEPPVPPPPATSTAPVLLFSDLTSGPKSGNTDTSLDQASGIDGAIVTIWGLKLGASQGTSTIACNGVAVQYVYYWGDAIPPHSPANLNNAYMNWQCVIFQVPPGAQDGLGEISVTVNGETSNALPFTVRTGRFFYVATTGNDSTGTGTFTAPFLTMPRAITAANQTGDTIYVRDGVNQLTADGAIGFSLVFDIASGNEAGPIALVAYPGAACTIGTTARNGISFRISGSVNANWVTVSKFTCVGKEVVIDGREGTRAVGCKVSAPLGATSTGSVFCQRDHVKFLGIEATDCGDPLNVNHLYHTFYISGVRDVADWATNLEEDREVAYCYIHDNAAVRGINVYSEDNGQGSRSLTNHRIHHNVIVDQTGDGILIGNKLVGDNWVYANLLIRCGLGPVPLNWQTDGATQHVGMNIRNVSGSTHIYNNTIKDCGLPDADRPVGYPTNVSGAFLFGNSTAVAGLDLHNNLTDQSNVAAASAPYLVGASLVPTVDAEKQSHNLWHGQGAAPSCDSFPVAADPLVVDSITPDMHLQSGSPARNAGMTPVTPGAEAPELDFDGITTPQESVYDIGAYEFFVAATVPQWVSNLAIGEQYRIPNSSFRSTAVSSQYTGNHPDLSYQAGVRDGWTRHGSGSFDIDSSIHIAATAGAPSLSYRFAYSGAPFDPVDVRLFAHGGGHNASMSNEVDDFHANVATPGPWNVLVQPTPAEDFRMCLGTGGSHVPPLLAYMDNNTGTGGFPLADGRHRIGHSNTRVFYLRSDKALWKIGANITYGGQGDASFRRLDLDPDSPTYKQWSASLGTSSLFNDYQDYCVQDFRDDSIYFIKNSGVTGGDIYKWGGPADPLNFTFQGRLTEVYAQGISYKSWGACIDTERNALVVATGGLSTSDPSSPLKIIKMDLASTAMTINEIDWAGSGVAEFEWSYAQPLEYDSDGDQYVMFNPSSQSPNPNHFWLIDASTLRISRLDLTGHSLPSTQFIGWTVTRLRYSSVLGGTLFCSVGPVTPTDDGCSVYFVRLH